MDEKRGGARPGSGRKPTGRVRKAYSVNWLLETVELVDRKARSAGLTRSDWLEEAATEKIMTSMKKKCRGLIPEERLEGLFEEALKKFGKNPQAFELAVDRCAAAQKGGHAKIAPGANEGWSEDQLLEAVDLILAHTDGELEKFWRGGSWWIVSPDDPEFDKFMEAKWRRPV